MIKPGTTEDAVIRNRVNLPTSKSHAEIVRDLDPKIRAQAFFSARVAEAHILDRLREISDAYSRGECGLGEARNRLKDFLRAEGYDPHQGGLRNLASTARLNLILEQNAAMTHAAAEWKRMHDPDAMKVFPYVRYHASVGSKVPRSDHQQYDGMIFDKNDPWLRTHTPPWDFGCHCELEEITAKEAGKTPELIRPPTPAEKVTVDSKSGFSFDPAHVFEIHNLGNIQPMSRAAIVKQAEDAVKNGQLGSVGLIAAPATSGIAPVPLPGISAVKANFDNMETAARKELVDVGLDPDHLPDYRTINQVFQSHGKQGKNIESAVLDKFPKNPLQVAILNDRATDAAGLPAQTAVMLGRGNSHHGISHLWRDHKELFVDPDAAIRLLQETLGDPNCRVVVSLKRAGQTLAQKGKNSKRPICLKRIVLHNPQKQTYCVMVYDGKELKLVSWNNAGDDYGDGEWTLE